MILQKPLFIRGFVSKCFIVLIMGFLCICNLQAQTQAMELNANVTVNSDRVQQSTNKNIYTTMERALNQFINDQRWSATTFSLNERIECTFSVTILTQPTENSFTAELFVQARRPVYNSSFVTTTLNFRDTNLEFEYMENAAIEMEQNTIRDNLVAVMAFYCNLIMGLDFDSFSPMGGNMFFRNNQTLVMQAQSGLSNAKGWSAFDDNRNRAAIANAFTDESLKPFRELWYTYHRKGLDEMAANPDRARTTILKALPVLKEIRSIRSSEILIQMFADCKLDEVVAIASKATTEEKKELYDLLRNIYPTMSSQLEPLKK